MSTNYEECVKQAYEMTNKITEKQSSWQHRILFLCATLFGILISLNSATQTNQYIRLCFASACVLLSLGILLLAISSYQHIVAMTRARNTYIEEVRSASKARRPVEPVLIGKVKIFGILETISYICLLFSMLLLALYSVLKALE